MSALSEREGSREVRLGLVMYGGVSLAVYINGACREFYDLVRGRGIWGIIKHLADVDVTVDIVSGASAGGINGLFLSYALCKETEFEPLARLWRENAGMQQLLQKPDREDSRSLLDCDFLEEKLKDAFETMSRAPCDTGKEIGSQKRPRELDCFLAVTDFHGHIETVGDFRDSPLQVKNHATRLHLKHRKKRKEPFGGAKELGPVSNQTLARFARATSAFPVAFEPVLLDTEEAGRFFDRRASSLAGRASAVFVDGGVLDNKPFTPILPAIYERHADRPVTRVLFFVEPDPTVGDEVTSLQDDIGGAADCPNFLQVAFASLTTLPSYESIADDLKALDEHNRRLDLLKTVLGDLYGSVRRGDPWGAKGLSPARPDKPASEQWRVYDRARLHSFLEAAGRSCSPEMMKKIESRLAPPNNGDPKAPRRAEHRILGQVFPEVAKYFQLKGLVDSEAEQDEEPETLECYLGWDHKKAKPLDEMDTEGVKRAYYYWTYALHEVLNPMVDELHRRGPDDSEAEGEGEKGDSPVKGAGSKTAPGSPSWCRGLGRDDLQDRIRMVRDALDALAERIDMLLVVESEIGAAIASLAPPEGDAHPFDAIRAVWTKHLRCPPEVEKLVSFEWEEQKPLSSKERTTSRADPSNGSQSSELRQDTRLRVVQEFRDCLSAPAESERVASSVSSVSLLAELRQTLDTIMEKFWGLGHTGRSAYDEFQRVDCLRYPAFLLSQLGEMDRIDYVRISPRDSCSVPGSFSPLGRWDDDPMSKVCGRRLGHFGGFLKRSWRSNDILWGRIDAATVVFDTLVGTGREGKLRLSRSRAKELLKDGDWVEKMGKFYGLDYDRKAKLVETLKLEEFVEGDLDEEEFRQGLLAFHQEQACREGVCEVLTDAVHEEIVRRNPTFGIDPLYHRDETPTPVDDHDIEYRRKVLEMLHRFQGETSDPLLRKVSGQVRLDMKTLDAFFRDDYDVGAERVSDLDRVGLATLGFQSARVLTKMSERLLPDRGWWQRAKNWVLTRVVLGLTTAHLFTQSVRNGLFPIVWVGTLLATIAFLVAEIVKDGTSWLWLGTYALILVALFSLPRLWFGRRPALRWICMTLLWTSVIVAVVFQAGSTPGWVPSVGDALNELWAAIVRWCKEWLTTPRGIWTVAGGLGAIATGIGGYFLRRWWKKRWPVWIGAFRIDDQGGPPGSLLTRIGRFLSFWRWREGMAPGKGDRPAGPWRSFLSFIRRFETRGKRRERLEETVRQLQKLSWMRRRVAGLGKYLEFATERLAHEEARLRQEEVRLRQRDDGRGLDDGEGGGRPRLRDRFKKWLGRWRRRPEVA